MTSIEKIVARIRKEGYPEVYVQNYQQGLIEGYQWAIRILLEHRFGPLSTKALQRLEAWPADRLEELLLAVQDASTLKALGLED